MTTDQIAIRLKELWNRGNSNTLSKKLFSDNAVSLEPRESPQFAKETKGIDAILKKGKVWNEMVTEQHSFEISDPVIADESFALTMFIDVSMKGRGRMTHKELCVYKVSGGKIVSEEFFL